MSIVFPVTKLNEFSKLVDESKDNRRLGQRFYEFMELSKCFQDKYICDRIYNIGDSVFWKYIVKFVDYNN